MTDPKMVITGDIWEGLTDKQQAKVTYDTVISMRVDLIGLSHKVDSIINKPATPCSELKERVDKLEKWSKFKNVATILGGLLSGWGSSHIPKP